MKILYGSTISHIFHWKQRNIYGTLMLWCTILTSIHMHEKAIVVIIERAIEVNTALLCQSVVLSICHSIIQLGIIDYKWLLPSR